MNPIDTLRSLAIKFPQCPLDHPRARFVHQLESPILRRITVAFVEFRKDFNRRRLRRVIVKPPSLADFPAVIIAVLRTRRSMQVDQHENVIFFAIANAQSAQYRHSAAHPPRARTNNVAPQPVNHCHSTQSNRAHCPPR